MVISLAVINLYLNDGHAGEEGENAIRAASAEDDSAPCM
jgi:hypothetical protein